jgi:hypothetical protein
VGYLVGEVYYLEQVGRLGLVEGYLELEELLEVAEVLGLLEEEYKLPECLLQLV